MRKFAIVVLVSLLVASTAAACGLGVRRAERIERRAAAGANYGNAPAAAGAGCAGVQVAAAGAGCAGSATTTTTTTTVKTTRSSATQLIYPPLVPPPIVVVPKAPPGCPDGKCLLLPPKK